MLRGHFLKSLLALPAAAVVKMSGLSTVVEQPADTVVTTVKYMNKTYSFDFKITPEIFDGVWTDQFGPRNRALCYKVRMKCDALAASAACVIEDAWANRHTDA